MLVGGPELFDEIRDAADGTEVDDDTGVNTAMTNMVDIMIDGDALADRRRQDRRRRSRYLDVAGYNYMDDPLRARPRALPEPGDRRHRDPSADRSTTDWAVRDSQLPT